MLNGIDPIIIFHISKLAKSQEDSVLKVPILSDVYNKIGLPPIPIYLSESATGLYIDHEEKNVDFETSIETLSTGGPPKTIQKAINSTQRVMLKAKEDSIGLVLLSALIDLILPKVTSGEYSITYMHGATTIFGGLIHSFAVTADHATDLLSVTIEISKTTQLQPPKTPIPEISGQGTGTTLEGANSSITPTAPTSPPLQGPTSVPVPPKEAAPVPMPKVGIGLG